MVDRSTDSSDAMVVFRLASSSLVGAALALMDSSTATCTVSVVVGGTVGTVVGFGVVERDRLNRGRRMAVGTPVGAPVGAHVLLIGAASWNM